MTDYYGIDVIHATTDYGEDAPDPLYPICAWPGCGTQLAKPGSVVCKRHIPKLKRAREQARYVVEVARQRRIEARLARGRILIHEWYTLEVER